MTLVTTQFGERDSAHPIERDPSSESAAGGAQDFLDALLAALTQMASFSPRRQADVAVAMRRAGLHATPEAVQSALDQLRRDGFLDRPLQLLDGGILVSVTARGIERLANTAHRHVVVEMMLPK